LKKKILFLNGVSDDGKIKVLGLQKNGALIYSVNGSADIGNYLPAEHFQKRFITLDATIKQNIIIDDKTDLIFNQISNADTHKITLAKAQKLYEMYKDKIPFFNPPEYVANTTRENTYQLLHDIDHLHVPKTVKIQPRTPSDIYAAIEAEGLTLPVIFRQAGDHGAKSTMRIDTDKTQFHAYALDGRDYYLTQFVEYKENNIYSKYRLVVIKGKVFLNDVMFGREWLLNNQSQDLQQTELKKNASKHFLNDTLPIIQPILTEIHGRLKLDYFGIDCHINGNGEILVFEINANMSIFRPESMANGIFQEHINNAYSTLIDILSQ